VTSSATSFQADVGVDLTRLSRSLREALSALLQRYPDHEFFTPSVFPEKFGQEVFQPLGFTREPLSQFPMRYDLHGAKKHSKPDGNLDFRRDPDSLTL
jgi:hypothetical protein